MTASLGGLMSVFGPLWAGVAYDQIGYATPFWTGAILLMVAWVFINRVRQPAVTLKPIQETT